MPNIIIETVIAALLVTGGAAALLGSLGLAKLGDFYKRLHGPTKATTLGVGSALLASCLWFSTRGSGLSLHELLITLFLALTAPVSAHQLARAAMRRHAAGAAGGQRGNAGNSPGR
jgi:multicomponent K+:H+ antiporter subunit G